MPLVRLFIAASLLAASVSSVHVNAAAQERPVMRAQERETRDPPSRAVTAVAPIRARTASRQSVLSDPETRRTIRANVRNLSDQQVEAAATMLDAPEPADFADIPDAAFRRVETLSAAQLNRLIEAAPRRSGRAAPGNIAPRPVRAQVQSDTLERIAPTLRPGRSPTVSPVSPGITDLAAPPRPYLDVNGFGQDLHAALSNTVNGYTMRMRSGGQTIYTLQWDWARRPGDGARGWNPNRRMHVASVSKFVTGFAMLHLLEAENIDVDSPIAPWLPAYWQRGANIDDITFADLLRHESGFSTGGSSSGYTFMRLQVAGGVSGTGGYDYENMNYGLMRILIATIGGYVSPQYLPGPVWYSDVIWDVLSLAAYQDYVEDNVFAPAGVSGPSLASGPATARAYTFTGGGSWNSGNLADFAGGAAWHMSVDEILDVASLFRRGNAGITPGQASNFLSLNYGVDGGVNTSAGPIFHKNGLWRNTSNCSGRSTEQSLLLFMPDDMEFALFVNSPVGANCTFLRSLVMTLYTNNLVEP